MKQCGMWGQGVWFAIHHPGKWPTLGRQEGVSGWFSCLWTPEMTVTGESLFMEFQSLTLPHELWVFRREHKGRKGEKAEY